MVLSEDVSQGRRLVQVACAVVFCLLSAGVLFGFAALKPVLVAEGVFGELCSKGAPCVEQDARLNLLFTISATITNVVALPVGSLLDQIGPRKTSMIGAAVFTLGNIFFGLGNNSIQSYQVGFSLLAIGGPMIFLPCFQLSNTFPQYSGLILSAVTGAFDASSLPYVIYRETYRRHRIPLRTFFWAYSVIGIVILVQQFFLGVDTPYGTPTQQAEEVEEPTERTSLLANEAMTPSAIRIREEEEILASTFSRLHYGDIHEAQDLELVKETLQQKDILAGQLYGQSAGQQIQTSWFFLVTAYLCLQMCRTNFYIETAEHQLYWYTGDGALADNLVTAFVFLLPLGGLAAVPFVGTLLDKRTSFTAFIILFVFGLAFGILTMTGSAAGQIAGICVFVILRPLMYTAISDYCAKVFGFVTFGRTYGLVNTISGLFGLIQYPLDLAIKYTFNGNPTPVNIGLTVVAATFNLALAVKIYFYAGKGQVQLD